MMRPASFVPEIVADQACRLGSGPAWHPVSGLLTWTDAQDGSLYSYHAVGAKSSRMLVGEKVHQCFPGEDGSMLLFTADGGLKVSRGADLKTLTKRLPWVPGAHVSAAALDQHGRLYCATRTADGRSGSLYRVRTDGGIEEALDGLGRVTGLGFDQHRSLMYCCIAESREVIRFTCDAVSGELSDRNVFVQLPQSIGTPHGVALDAKGFVWTPIWGGSCVMRFAPTGKEERRTYFTAKLLSGLTFGGPDLRDLFVVSSGAEDRRANGPGAGALYKLRPGVKGAPQPLANAGVSSDGTAG